MGTYAFGATVVTKEKKELLTGVKKLREVLSASKFPTYSVLPDDKDFIRLKGKDSKILIHIDDEEDDGDGRYHISVDSVTDEDVVTETNMVLNKILDFFVVIPTVMVKVVELRCEYSMQRLNIPFVRIIDPVMLVNIADKTGLRLTPRTVSLSCEVNDWDILYIVYDIEAVVDEDKETAPALLLLHKDVSISEKDVIQNALEAARRFEKQIKAAEEGNQTG